MVPRNLSFPAGSEETRTRCRGAGRALFSVLLFLAVMFQTPSLALAEKPTKKAGGVIRLEETIIEGRVQKPNAFFINTRQALVYEATEINESFLKEISKAVKNGPF